MENSTACVKEITAIFSALPSWRPSLERKCTAEDVARRVQDVAEQIFPKDVSNYMNCDYAKSAEDILHDAARNPAINYNSNDFSRIRNHLLVVLSIYNAQRTVS